MPFKPTENKEEGLSYSNSFDELANMLTNYQLPIEITSFDQFVQEIGCKSYPDYKFDSWHIRYVCQWVDDVMASKNKLGIAGLPRGHLKSTILGYLFTIYRMITSKGNGKGLYISYKDELALYHMANIKSAITNNPILNKFFKDLVTQSRSALRYQIGNRVVEIMSSGIFSAKRGLHCDCCLTGDTPVYTGSGYRPISSIRIGDKVKTQENVFKKVLSTSVRDISEDIKVLYLSNGEIIRVTTNHPILTKTGWKEAGELTNEDILLKLSFGESHLKGSTHIIKIDSEYFVGKVYNLEVEEIHSYCGKGIIFHNCVIVDDILGTVDNPMMLTEIDNAANQFNKEVVPVPNLGCPMLVFGTAIDYSDLLFTLRANPQYMSIWLPAIDPLPDHEVLWDRYNKQILEDRKEQQGWKAFSTEYLLIPVTATNAFFSREELKPVLNNKLMNFKPSGPPPEPNTYWWQRRPIVAGFDIGMKSNPSHMSVFAVDDANPLIEGSKQRLIMLHQRFLDKMEYTKQIDYIYHVMEYFRVDKMFYDNTRSEFTERGLPRGCIPIILGGRTGSISKGKSELSTNFSKLVEQLRIELIDDDRYIASILSVTNDLQAPDRGGEHGDAFISTMLAIGAFTDYFEYGRGHGFSYLGDLQEIIKVSEDSPMKDPNQKMEPMKIALDKLKGKCKLCGKPLTQKNGKAYCEEDLTFWEN